MKELPKKKNIIPVITTKSPPPLPHRTITCLTTKDPNARPPSTAIPTPINTAVPINDKKLTDLPNTNLSLSATPPNHTTSQNKPSPTINNSKSPHLIDEKSSPKATPASVNTSPRKVAAASLPAVKTPLNTLSKPLLRKMLSFLPLRDLISFAKASKSNNEDANSQIVWKTKIDQYFPEEYISENEDCKKLFSSKVSLRKESVIIPHSPSIHVSFLKNITTLRDFKETLSKITSIPIDKIILEISGRGADRNVTWTVLRPDSQLMSDFLPDYLHTDGTPHVPYPETRLKCSRRS